MKTRTVPLIALAVMLLFALTTVALAQPVTQAKANGDTLVKTVRLVTQKASVTAAEANGHGRFLGCVSGPEGSMGVHYPNPTLVGDGILDANRPEVLVYEPKNGKLELAAVEYLVLYDDWHANNDGPPVLAGQVFNYVGSPNRYGMPAFYELHVWAWKDNPNGVFADWNPNVSCETYAGESVFVNAQKKGLVPR